MMGVGSGDLFRCPATLGHFFQYAQLLRGEIETHSGYDLTETTPCFQNKAANLSVRLDAPHALETRCTTQFMGNCSFDDKRALAWASAAFSLTKASARRLSRAKLLEESSRH